MPTNIAPVRICQILDDLENTSKRTEKESILRTHQKNLLLREVFKAALDPYTNYGVVKFDRPSPAPASPIPELEDEVSNALLETFLTELLPKLAERELTGNAAKEAVTSYFIVMNASLQKWCERILVHKLRNGVQTKTVNKIWPKLICPFEVQLASTLASHKDESGFTLDDPVKFPILVEPKLDGLRLVAIKNDGIVTLYTRNGTELNTLPTLSKWLKNANIDNVVFDGEIMGDDWNESASIVMSRKRHKDDSNMTYHVFDYMSLSEWTKQSCPHTQQQRRINLRTVLDAIHDGPIKMTEEAECNSAEELYALYEAYLEQGYEGVMVKRIEGMYAFKRNADWRKLKPVATYEGVVVDTYDGNKGSKREGKFGGFNVVFPNGIVTNVGSGFSDLEKATVNEDRDSWIGKIVEVEGQPPMTKDGKVRFPRKVRYREESDVDPLVMKAFEDYEY